MERRTCSVDESSGNGEASCNGEAPDNNDEHDVPQQPRQNVLRTGNAAAPYRCMVLQMAPPTIGMREARQPHLAIPTFVSTFSGGRLDKSVVKAGDPLTWHHTNHMGVIFRIQAAARFSLECNHDTRQIVALSTENADGKFDVYVPTGIPIATVIFNPLTVRFKTEFHFAVDPETGERSEHPLYCVTDPLPVTVYGHRWDTKPENLPMFGDCCVPFRRNYLRVNHVAMQPLFPLNLETGCGF